MLMNVTDNCAINNEWMFQNKTPWLDCALRQKKQPFISDCNSEVRLQIALQWMPWWKAAKYFNTKEKIQQINNISCL